MLSFDKNCINIVDGQDYGGINDRFVALPTHLIDKVFNLFLLLKIMIYQNLIVNKFG